MQHPAKHQKPRGKQGQRPEWTEGDIESVPCRYCDTKFLKTRPDKEFCKPYCRIAYHKQGGAYRKLKAELPPMIKTALSEMRAEISKEIFDAVSSAREQLRDEIKAELSHRWHYYREAQARRFRRLRQRARK